MIKILYIINNIKEAGAQKHLLDLINGLHKESFQIWLALLQQDQSQNDLDIPMVNLNIKRIYDFNGIKGLFELIKLIKKERFDIVHSYLFSENILGSIAAKIANGPVIITGRRDTGMLCQGRWQHILAYKFVNRWTNMIVCVSEAVKQGVLAKEKADPAKVEVIYNGVDVNRFNCELRTKNSELKSSLLIEYDENILGIIANLSWIKGYKDFIEAARLVSNEVPNVKFLLIGNGVLLENCKKQVEENKLRDRVLFLGTRKDIPELLSIMDISVNASYSEGMSNTILESMASGVPVVATAVDGNLETVVDGVTGILVPPKNPKAMAEAIIRILKDKELAKKMGENARNLVKEKFTSEIMIKNMENLYKRLLKPKIAFVLSQFPETYETFILREFKALKEKGIEFEIFSLKPCRDKVIHLDAIILKEKTTYCRIHSSKFIIYSLLHPLKTINSFLYVIKSYFRNPKELIKAIYVWLECFYIAEIIKKERIRHIHSHWATIPTTAAVILSKLTGIQFSFTAHAWDIFMNSNGLDGKINKAKFVVTCTDYNRSYLSGLAKNKIYLNYHGIDLDKFKTRKLDNPQTRQLKILAIGRLVETKGFKYLIEACAILRDRGISFECNIVGQGQLLQRLKTQVARHKLDGYVKFLGIKTQEEIKKLFNEATVFIQPSVIARSKDRDGIPNVILEAMALGVPVIATNVSGIPEAVVNGQTGILVEPNDSSALAVAIESLYSDIALRNDLTVRARNLIEGKFNTTKNTEELINIFKENGILN